MAHLCREFALFDERGNLFFQGSVNDLSRLTGKSSWALSLRLEDALGRGTPVRLDGEQYRVKVRLRLPLWEIYDADGNILFSGSRNEAAHFAGYSPRSFTDWLDRMDEDPDLLTPEGLYFMKGFAYGPVVG